MIPSVIVGCAIGAALAVLGVYFGRRAWARANLPRFEAIGPGCSPADPLEPNPPDRVVLRAVNAYGMSACKTFWATARLPADIIARDVSRSPIVAYSWFRFVGDNFSFGGRVDANQGGAQPRVTIFEVPGMAP